MSSGSTTSFWSERPARWAGCGCSPVAQLFMDYWHFTDIVWTWPDVLLRPGEPDLCLCGLTTSPPAALAALLLPAPLINRVLVLHLGRLWSVTEIKWRYFQTLVHPEKKIRKSFNWNFIRLSVEFAPYLWFVLEWIFRVNPSFGVIYAPALSAPHLR